MIQYTVLKQSKQNYNYKKAINTMNMNTTVHMYKVSEVRNVK